MKYFKRILIAVILAAIIIVYYIHVGNISNQDPTDKLPKDSELYKLITRDLDGQYYPEFPRGVVDFYAQITKAYYYYDLTEAQIEALGTQAKKLFDEELVKENPDDKFFDLLKKDIEYYRTNKVKITDYSVEKSSDIDMYTFDGREYASVRALYYVSENEGTSRKFVYQDYTLRKDSDGRWKILFWESADAPEE